MQVLEGTASVYVRLLLRGRRLDWQGTVNKVSSNSFNLAVIFYSSFTHVYTRAGYCCCYPCVPSCQQDGWKWRWAVDWSFWKTVFRTISVLVACLMTLVLPRFKMVVKDTIYKLVNNRAPSQVDIKAWFDGRGVCACQDDLSQESWWAIFWRVQT